MTREGPEERSKIRRDRSAEEWPPASDPEMPPTAKEDAEAQRQRDELGLRNDAAYRAEVRRRFPEFNGHGIPLTPDELQDLRLRQTVAAHIPIVSARAEREERFAGIWMDNRKQGTVFVALATDGDHSELEAELRQLLRARGKLRVVHRKWTLAELEDVYGKLVADLPRLKAEGHRIAGIGTDIINNRVEALVSMLTDSDTVALSAKYDDDPRIVSQPGTSRRHVTSNG